jgi:Cytochrome C oxidase, cbb3-type, subunit III
MILLTLLLLAQSTPGATLFDNHCAACHTGTDPRVPTVAALRQRTPESIVDALTIGAMRQQGAALSDAERRAVADYLVPKLTLKWAVLAFGVDEGPTVDLHQGARALQVARALQGARAFQASDHARDLDGIWSFATLTPFERPAELAAKPYFTDEEAAAFVADTLSRNDRDRRDGGAAVDAARGVADFWFDRGTGVATLDGKKLTSLVIDPPDGRVPPQTADARARAAARNADNRDHPADGPENRSLQERCLWFNAGPPINLGPYNNYVPLLQMPNAVIIFTEMIHDARIVWMDGRPQLPPNVEQWLGDSRGRWDGNTLVVDTTNLTEKTGFRGSSDRLHLVERFTRTGPDALRYEYTVDDPATFTKPWTAVLPMTKSDERLYEYACHEGNYALPDILRGARYQERIGK